MSSSPPAKITIAFDLYGTILSTSSISTTLSSLLDITPDKAIEVAELWRRYQLEYTWRANCMKKYQPFEKITISSLRHALAQLSIPIPSPPTSPTNTTTTSSSSQEETFQTAILSSYDNLTPFPDALNGLSLLSSNSNISPYIFSNGTHPMISASIAHSLSPSSNPFTIPTSTSTDKTQKTKSRLISIDSMVPQPLYKPAPEAYHHLLSQVGEGETGSVWLVSSNPFDVVGAKNFGLRTAWVDRSVGGVGWVDALADGEGEDGGEGMPDLAVDGVDDAIIGILEFEEERGGRREG